MLLIDPDGRPQEVVIGPEVHAGQHPQFLVPANWWQGSSTDGAWSLVSTAIQAVRIGQAWLESRKHPLEPCLA